MPYIHGMDRMSHPQYSPDGRWWWDGVAWTEVTPDWPPRSEVAPVLAIQSEAPPPSGPGVVRPLLMAVGAVLALIAIGTGGVWGWQHRPPLPALSLPTPAPTATPIPSSSLPAEKYPYRYMSNLRVSDVTDRLEQQGFTCRQPQPLGDLGLAEWHCDRSAGTVTYSVTIDARSETKVHMISAIAIGAGGKPAIDGVTPLFALLAGLPFSKQQDLADQAGKWVQANADKDANSTFGQIAFGTLPGDQDYFMEMDAGFVR